MGYRTEHFTLAELVPPEIFEALGDKAWELLDDGILQSADQIRERFGVCVINNWAKDGPYRYSGFRPAECEEGAVYSQHRYGRALDIKPRDATPQQVYEYILGHQSEFPFITTIEDINHTPTWVHVDRRNNWTSGIRRIIP